MILEYFRKLFHLTKEEHEEREKESRLEAELEFLENLSKKAKEGNFYGMQHRQYKYKPGEHIFHP